MSRDHGLGSIFGRDPFKDVNGLELLPAVSVLIILRNAGTDVPHPADFRMVDPRPAKKARPIADPPQHAGPSNPTPRLFAPFRALGLVCNALPFAMFVHTPSGALAQPTVNLVTSVGTSWMMWDMAGMTLVFVSPDADEELGGLAMTGTEIFASTGGRVRRYLRGKEVGLCCWPEGSQLMKSGKSIRGTQSFQSGQAGLVRGSGIGNEAGWFWTVCLGQAVRRGGQRDRVPRLVPGDSRTASSYLPQQDLGRQ